MRVNKFIYFCLVKQTEIITQNNTVMKSLVFLINNNGVTTEETLRTYLKGKSWKVNLNPIGEDNVAILYNGSDIDMIIGTVSTPNWGEYTLTQVIGETDESIMGMFGVADEPTVYILKCFELL